MTNNIFLIEDHDEALRVWRQEKIKGIDLVHIDAHMDFGIQPAKPIDKIFRQAKSLKELKRGLEYSLAFMRYERDFDKQTNIGNYIYPAMCEGIVKDFYWVVPGGLKEFRKGGKFIRNMLKSFAKWSNYPLSLPCRQAGAIPALPTGRRYPLKEGIISANLFGRKFVICILDKLPILRQKILLDIDTDFLVVDSLLNANNTAKIGKRKPWILPQKLTDSLKEKIEQPEVITIAYSVNGGYMPMKYKHLGDEIACLFAPEFKMRLERNLQAAEYFNVFVSCGKKEYYQKAVTLNPSYRAGDNNYGALYLSLRRFLKAEDEFLKIAGVDPGNPYPVVGLGNVALERKDYKKARRYFSSVLRLKNDDFSVKARTQALFGLARAEFRLRGFKKAKKLFFRLQALKPLEPQSYYFLGRILEKEKNFKESAGQYQQAMSLGLNNLELISRLLKISYHFKQKDDIIKYVIVRYKEFKKGFLRAKRLGLKAAKKFRGLQRIEEKMIVFERRLFHGVGKYKTLSYTTLKSH